MDERQREVQVGAGLQESRLNTEFISFLQVWGPRVLYVLLAIVLVYIGLQYLDRWRQEQVNEAYKALSAARDSQSVVNLLDVADTHRSQNAVWTQAILFAGRLVCTQTRLGYLDPSIPEGADEPELISTNEKLRQIDLVLEPLREVARENTGDEKTIFAGEAYWTLASLLLTKADLQPEARDGLFEEAQEVLRKGASRTRVSGYPEIAERFDARNETLFGDTGVQLASTYVDLPRRDELPESARRPERLAPPSQGQDPMQMIRQGGNPGGTPIQVIPGTGEQPDVERLRQSLREQGLDVAPSPEEPSSEPQGDPEPPGTPEEPSVEPDSP